MIVSTPGNWTNAFIRFANDPNKFFMALMGIPTNTSEGQKFVDITAVDWVGNTSLTTVPAFVVDKTLPRLLSVDLSGTGSNLYLPNAQILYYGPLSTGTLFVQAQADDANGELAVAGIESIWFPNLFGSGGSVAGDGSVLLALTQEYPFSLNASSSNAGAYRILSVTDRAENTALTPDTVTHFTVTYDAVSPQFGEVTLQAQSGSAHLYISGQTLYYGPLSSGSFAINATATDGSSGVRDVTFPALFGAGSLAVGKQLGSDLFGRTYTINGSTHTDEGSVSLIAADNVGNTATNSSIVVHKDATAPVLSNYAVSLDSPGDAYLDGQTLYYGPASTGTLQVSVSASDSGSGVRDVTFPDLFGAGTVADAAAPYQRSYTIQGDSTSNGAYPITAADRVGNTSSLNLTLVKDSTAPIPTLDIPDSPGLIFTIAWNATDGQTGIRYYDLEYSLNGGTSWLAWQTQVTTTSARFSADGSHTYQFRVRATDTVGNTSAWLTGSVISIATVTKYYHLGGQRVAMRKGTGANSAVYYLHGDHDLAAQDSGSTSLITNGDDAGLM